MRNHRRLARIKLAAIGALLALPFCLVTVLYLHTLNGLGELPRPAPERPLPRLIALGIWVEIGESRARFEIETTWPWTPVLDLALGRNPRTTPRPGAMAADRVAGLWLASRPRTRIGLQHLRRAALSVWLSRHWSAAELTREMASRSYFGRRAFGIDQAASSYFGKSPETLTSGEAALLVGLLASPHRYSHDRSLENTLKRRNLLLDRWAAAGLIQLEDAAVESSKPLRVLPVRESGEGTETKEP